MDQMRTGKYSGFIFIVILLMSPHLHGEEILRDKNITDIEVREIQSAMRSERPGPIRYIGAVTKGCSCTEGDACDAQVVVLTDSEQIDFSHIDSKWQIGIFQKWKFKLKVIYDAYHATQSATEQERLYAELRAHLKVNPKICEYKRKEK